MAETYKGLTIRIGGDTTRLQSALRSADSAISNTQRQLRAMTQALKMDPSSTSALNRQLELTGRRAVEINQRLATLKSSLRDISGQRVDFLNGEQSAKTIGQLASETADASKRAAEAKESYNAINGELERLYKSINSAARANKQFGKSFDVREQVLSYGDLRDKLVQAGAATDQQIDRVNELRAAWKGAFEENEVAKAVARVEDLNSEMIKTEASAKQVSRQFADMSRASFSKSIGADLEKELQDVAKAADKVEDRVSRLQKALDVDPGNIETVRLALDTIDEAAANAEDRLDLLRQKVAAMDAQGIGDLAEGIDQTALSAQRAADEYADVTEQVNRCQGEIRSLAEQQRALESHGDTTSDRYKELGNEIREAESRLAQLVARQREMQASADNGALVQEYREAKVQIAEAAAEVQRLKQAQSEITGFKGLSSQTLMELGMTLSTSVTPAILSFGASAIQSAEEIDSAYRDMRKTVDGTEADFERLRQAAVDFSTTHVTSADQILQIQAIGGELGVATEDLQTFAETVSNLDVATDLDAETAATALGQLDNIMNDLSGATMPQFSDALVRLGNNGASTESQIIDIAKRIGSMASIIDMSTPDVLAWASSIASTGQNAEAAGTAISNTMADIESAVASGGDSLMAFAEVSGMSAQEFASAWESDPSTAMRSFIEGLNGIEEDGGSATATLSGLGITATRQVQAIEGLMQTIGGLDDNLRMSNDAWNGVSDKWGEAGDAANEASKKAEGFSGSLSRLQNMAQVLGSEIGESLVPFIDLLADVLGDATEWFVDLPDAVQTFISALGGMTAAVGPMLLIGRAIGSLKEDLNGFLSPITSASSATEAFTNVLGGLKGGLIGLGIGAATVAIGAFATACYDAYEEQRRFNESVEDFSDASSDSSSLMDYSGGIADIGAEAEASSVSLDALSDSMERHAEAMQQNTEAAKGQIAQLSTAQGIINTYAGVTDLSAQAQGRLQWALDLVNQEFGLSISQADVAKDKYVDQNGAVQDLTDTINALVEAKKNEARVDAITANLTEAYSAQTDAAKSLAQAQADYNDQVQEYIDSGMDPETAREAAYYHTEEGKALRASEQSYAEATKAVRENEESLGVATKSASEAADAYDALSTKMDQADFTLFSAQLEQAGTSFGSLSDDLRELGANTDQFAQLQSEDLEYVASQYDGTSASLVAALQRVGVQMDDTKVKSVESAAAIRQSLMSWGDGAIQEVLNRTGIDIDVLSTKMANSSMASQNMSKVTQEQFAAMASAANGDVNRMIFMLENYNSVPIYDKNGKVTITETNLIDANDNLYTWNGTELLDHEGSVVVDQVELQDAYGNVVIWNGTELKPMDTEVTCDWSDLVEANEWIDTVLSKNGRKSKITVETVYKTTYTTSGTPSGGSSGGSGGSDRSAAQSLMYAAARTAPSVQALSYDPSRYAAIQPMSVPKAMASSVPDLSGIANGIVYDMNRNLTARASGGYAGSVDASRRASTINQYYIGDTSVTTMNDQEFAREFVNLMDRYGRLART